MEKKASEPKNTRDRAKTGFSNIVGQRILEKKTSFNLTLRRGQSFTSDQKSNADDSMKDTNTVEIKVINFGENPELKEILNRFHHKQDDDTLNNKYVIIYIYILSLYKYDLALSIERNIKRNP